jgi:hypothetical protein
VALPGPVGYPAAADRGDLGQCCGRGRGHIRGLAVTVAGDGGAQALTVLGNGAFDRLPKVVPHVPAVSDLDGRRRPAGGAIGIARSRQITWLPGWAASQAANASAERPAKMSIGRRVALSTSTVP